YDPMLALDGGEDGLAAYRAIAPRACAAIKPRGALMVEIGFDQGEAVAALFIAAGFTNVAVRRDLGDRDRVVIGYKPG
ncbi:peptide chain release factor N(5)-glutamine methyltransferase, partial [Acinetobacter baumannii]